MTFSDTSNFQYSMAIKVELWIVTFAVCLVITPLFWWSKHNCLVVKSSLWLVPCQFWWLNGDPFFPTCQVRVVRFYQSCSPPRPPPRSPDPSGHSRTSTASSRSQWALPDLNRDFQIAVGTAGPQPRLPDRSGHCRTSTATSRSQWAPPDLNGQIECQIECQKICQIECQKICQIECQKICQTECQKICQNICQIECQKICQIECQKICQ